MHCPVRDRVLELFESQRALPGAPFEEAHFLDFLLADPSSIGAVRNTFKGLRRFNKFVDAVQYEFAVCFSTSDFDSNWSVEKFVERIKYLQLSRRGSLQSLNNQERAGANWGAVMIADLILLSLASIFRHTWWVAIPLIVVALSVTVRYFFFARSQAAYRERLRSRIEGNKQGAV